MAERFSAAFDGGSRGNPGLAAWGVAVFDEDGNYVEGHGGSLGHATNNVAEYNGLLQALELAVAAGAQEVSIAADSELIVRQITGRYRVRSPDLIPLFQRAKQLISGFARFHIRHVRREQNREADRMVNQALDQVAAAPDAPVHIVDRPDTG